MRLWLHPRSAECGQVEARTAVENQLVVYEVIRGAWGHPFFWDRVSRCRAEQRSAGIHGANDVRPLQFPRKTLGTSVLFHLRWYPPESRS